jgi:tetratricopeptide (TPR) repeat protein
MKPLAVLAVSALVSGVMIVLAFCWQQKNVPASAATPGAGAAEVVALARSVSELSAEQAQLRKGIDDLRAEITARPQSDARLPVGEIDAAVKRALAQQVGETRGAEAAASDASAGKAAHAAAFDVQAALEQLTSKRLSPEQRQALWKQIADAGQLDAMVALLEQRAKDDPTNATAQLDLGRAYLQKIFKVGNGPEAGIWGTKADQAFDAALTIDDHNWDARFAKAVSLSFWPPMLGKQNEAIKNFEVLVDQQAGQPAKPEFAQTYYFLGNMYTQTGDKAKALATWQQGLTLFPGNAQLEAQIANAQGH